MPDIEVDISNKTFFVKEQPTFPASDMSTHKTFVSGGQTFSQITIYSDGEVWYGNDTVAYANGEWEIEYRYLTFGANQTMPSSDYNKFAMVYDEYTAGAKKLYFRIDNGEYKLATLNGKNKGVWDGEPWDNTSNFSNDSWATIAQNIKAGTDNYRLGDTKTDSVTISGTQYDGTYNVTFKIVDDKVGRYATQSGQSHKVIEIQQIFGCNQDGGVVWNSSGSGTSFNASDIKNILNNTIINFLPSELRAVLETTTVYSGDGTQTASASTNVGATCKLFVASYNEYYGADASYGWANNTETNGKGQYTWYQQAGVTTSNYADMKKYKIEDTSIAYYYWTRSPYGSGLFNSAVYVRNYGNSVYDGVSVGSDRVAPCFAW